MPLKKVIKGSNMYQDWITHTHTHLGGECSHKCSYCYVKTNRFGRAERYKGDPRLIEKELSVNYGTGKTIFIEHMNDMFARGIESDWIKQILDHCQKYKNKYVFQTKDPLVASYYARSLFPRNFIIGTTIETNREDALKKISTAPVPRLRVRGIKNFSRRNIGVFVTIEPIMDFDVDELVEWLVDIEPLFINIGADSKQCGLPEPSADKVKDLIKAIQDKGLTIKKKFNLSRLLKAEV